MNLVDFLDQIDWLVYQAEADLTVDPIALNSIRARLLNLQSFVDYLITSEVAA